MDTTAAGGEAAFAAADATQAATAAAIVVCRGAPVFLDGDVAALAQSDGPAAAWLALYRRAGSRAPERVHGRFAIVIIERAPRTLFAAVDRFASESLCYSVEATRVAFADRADGVPGAHRPLDLQAIYDYVYFHVIPAPRTILRGVQRLLPGHRLTVEHGRCTAEPYWVPVFEDAAAPAPLPALRREFREILHDAVARESDTPALGCYLSGGTDSSTVAGLVTKITGRPARTYSIGFDVAGYDEMAYARIAARHFGTDHHERYVSPQDLVEHVPAILAAFDQPFGNSSALPAFCCAQMARADGLDKMLAGDGGDELFGGNSRYARQRVFEAYEVLPAALRRSVLEPLARRHHDARFAVLRKFVRYVEQATTPMPQRMEIYNLLMRMGVSQVFEPEFLAMVDQDEPAHAQRAVYDGVRAASMMDRMLGYDWKFTLADNDLPKVTGSARLAGIRVGFPLLDERLVDFSLRLPPSMKVRGLKLRWFFKDALADFLPRSILRKKKHGFGLPFGTWATRHVGLRELTMDALSSLKRRRIVRASFIDNLVGNDLPAHPGYYGEMVWILMALELWLAAYDAGAPPAPRATPPQPASLARSA